jgi:hypothetical protein
VCWLGERECAKEVVVIDCRVWLQIIVSNFAQLIAATYRVVILSIIKCILLRNNVQLKVDYLASKQNNGNRRATEKRWEKWLHKLTFCSYSVHQVHITRISSTFSRKQNETKNADFFCYSCCLYFAAFASFWLTRIQYLDLKGLFLLLVMESGRNTYNVEQDLLPAERNCLVELRVMKAYSLLHSQKCPNWQYLRPCQSWGLVKGIVLYNREELELSVEFFTVLEWLRKRSFVRRKSPE